MDDILKNEEISEFMEKLMKNSDLVRIRL